MTVFVESNFVLELVFRQEEYRFCERIRQGAGPATYALHLPQYALTEVFQTMRARRERRKRYQTFLAEEITQHRREAESDNEAMDILSSGITTLLLARTQTQTQRLYDVTAELAQTAAAGPLTPAIIQEAQDEARQHDLASQDSLVYASVLAGLRALPADAPKLFVSRNKKDFNKKALLAELRALGCDYVVSFQAAAGILGV